MLTIVSNVEVWRGNAARVLVSTDRCPCCGGEIRTFELEWEVSGLPVAERTECTHCEWAQGWGPEAEWARTPDFPPAPAEVVCIAG